MERLGVIYDLLMEPEIVRAEIIIRVAKGAAKELVSGNSDNSQAMRDQISIDIMEAITSNLGLNCQDGRLETDRKVPQKKETAV